jgi:hypothetical protein
MPRLSSITQLSSPPISGGQPFGAGLFFCARTCVWSRAAQARPTPITVPARLPSPPPRRHRARHRDVARDEFRSPHPRPSPVSSHRPSADPSGTKRQQHRLIAIAGLQRLPSKRSPDGAQRNPGFRRQGCSPGFRFAPSGLRHSAQPPQAVAPSTQSLAALALRR